MTLTFVGARLVPGDGSAIDGWLRVEGERIAALGAGEPPSPGGELVDLEGAILAPGLVDLHCHGGGGAAVYSGDVEDVRRVAAAHLARGTTAMLGSVATVEPAAMLSAVRAVADGVRDPSIPNLVGVHLEGPFLAPSRRGAQTESALRSPDPAILEALLDAAEGMPVVMTIAPELPGAIELIAGYADRCTFAVGHTAAAYEQVVAAADAGARHVTHLYNAMPGLGHREPGPVAAALTDPRLTYELIADGHHIASPSLRVASLPDDASRAVLVTDAMAAAGLGDGEYAFADRRVDVRGGVARLAGTERLAGSTAFLADCVRHMVDVAGLPVERAVRMATRTPAAVIGEAPERGVLAPGSRADLLVLGPGLVTRSVYLGGELAA